MPSARRRARRRVARGISRAAWPRCGRPWLASPACSASRIIAAIRDSRSRLGEPSTASLWTSGTTLVTNSVGHVHEAAVVALEGDRDVRGWAVAVLDEHDVGLAGPRRFLFVHILSVNHHDHIRVLFD